MPTFRRPGIDISKEATILRIVGTVFIVFSGLKTRSVRRNLKLGGWFG